jgi:hypothetical protein
VLLKLTKEEIQEIQERSNNVDSLFKKIGHKLYNKDNKKDKRD